MISNPVSGDFIEKKISHIEQRIKKSNRLINEGATLEALKNEKPATTPQKDQSRKVSPSPNVNYESNDDFALPKDLQDFSSSSESSRSRSCSSSSQPLNKLKQGKSESTLDQV